MAVRNLLRNGKKDAQINSEVGAKYYVKLEALEIKRNKEIKMCGDRPDCDGDMGEGVLEEELEKAKVKIDCGNGMRTVLLIKIGSNDRPATPQDIKDIVDVINAIPEKESEKLLTLVGHHAITMEVMEIPKDAEIKAVGIGGYSIETKEDK